MKFNAKTNKTFINSVIDECSAIGATLAGNGMEIRESWISV